MITITATNATHFQTSPASAAAPTVFVVDDDVSIRESVELLIESSGWWAETFASAKAFLARPRKLVPSCLVLDITLPHLNGLDLQKRVAVDRRDMPVIFIAGYGDVPMSVQAMKAGAIDFLTKPFGEDVLLSAIHHALERSRRALELEARLKAVRESYESLTPREREVMVLVVSGLLNKQMGGELGISEITVKAAPGSGDSEDEGRFVARAREHGRTALASRRSIPRSRQYLRPIDRASRICFTSSRRPEMKQRHIRSIAASICREPDARGAGSVQDAERHRFFGIEIEFLDPHVETYAFTFG